MESGGYPTSVILSGISPVWKPYHRDSLNMEALKRGGPSKVRLLEALVSQIP